MHTINFNLQFTVFKMNRICNLILLYVISVGTAPEFIKKLHPTEMGPLGGEMIFSVQVHGKPMPDVTW